MEQEMYYMYAAWHSWHFCIFCNSLHTYALLFSNREDVKNSVSMENNLFQKELDM